jgi:hypothetical protein
VVAEVWPVGRINRNCDADGEMAGLRQTTAGRLPDRSRRGFLPFKAATARTALVRGRADPTGLSNLITLV